MGNSIRNVAVIGTGAIGASWAALFLAQGLQVSATDIAPNAEAALHDYIDQAWPALTELGLAKGANRSNLRFSTDMAEAVAGAELVQENGPERIDFKIALYEKLDSLLGPETVIASSSSGLTMSAIQVGCKRYPKRCVIGHPFNPPHLIPLVEVVGGKLTSEDSIQRVTAFYAVLGKRTVRLQKEMPGHVANRLAAALYREMVYLIAEDVISVADADTAVCWGPGLRWGVMGPSLLYHLGGGAGGIDHFFDQFTQPLQDTWAALGTPQLTIDVRKKIVDGILREADGRSLPVLASQRDQALLALLAARTAE